MAMFFVGAQKPITEELVQSLSFPGAITATVEAYRIDNEIVMRTCCENIRARRMHLKRLLDFRLPEGATPFMVVEPVSRDTAVP